MDDALRQDIQDALAKLCRSCNLDAWALFSDRAIDDFASLPSEAAYCGGFIEGAALAYELTVLELLDVLEIDVGEPP